MKVTGIIHQQICQLKWHLLACLGLIMVLPIEEAMVSFKAGSGFFSDSMAFTAMLFGPLLAGLIACANVQGDLDEKRYIFWRSKPANIKFFISLKFFIGLVASVLVIGCPLVFHIVTNIIWNQGDLEKGFFKYYVPAPVLISIMTYSLCFTCNVLVRKTARAWLIGMLVGGFLLVLPFLLPLDFKDYMDVIFWSQGAFLVILLIVPATAFVLAIYAAKQDWHLKTNLKVLLWVVGGLAFVLLMLFSSQVANIKILKEKEIEISNLPGQPSIEDLGDKLIFQGQRYIQIDEDSIFLSEINKDPNSIILGVLHDNPIMAGHRLLRYPENGRLYKNAGNDLYSIIIHAYYRTEGQSPKFYEKVYLRSYKHTNKYWKPVCELDISECLAGNINSIRLAMRLIDNRLIVCVDNSVVVADIANPEQLKLIDKRLDVLQLYLPFYHRVRTKEFSIPLVPIEEIELQERIRLSIDLIYQFRYGASNDIYESSIVDVQDDMLSFFMVNDVDVARFNVTHWDDENIYCRFGTSRPFTILESITGTPHFYSHKFVKNGKLYCYDYYGQTLMVFDTRSKQGIRKLGHFVRMDYRIEDIEVLEDGNMLVCMQYKLKDFDRERLKRENKYYLYLLENPE